MTVVNCSDQYDKYLFSICWQSSIGKKLKPQTDNIPIDSIF